MADYTDSSNYGYTPSEAFSIVFIVLFALAIIIHSVQAAFSRYWIIYPTLVLGALIELMGWSARLWSSLDVLRLDPFLMQICLLIMAPVFFSAYDYAVLGTAIHRLGEQYSILRPNWYFIVFITADIISLILQAVGGGQASATAATGAPTQGATNIMVAGIIFQLGTMAIFIACGIDFCLRARANRPYAFQVRRIAREAEKRQQKQIESARANPSETTLPHADSDTTVASVNHPAGRDVEKQGAEGSNGERENLGRWWIMMLGVGISSACIFWRGIYRSIELLQGWTGYLITHEVYQLACDGLPMIIAVGIFIVINPLYVLPKKAKWGPYY